MRLGDVFVSVDGMAATKVPSGAIFIQGSLTIGVFLEGAPTWADLATINGDLLSDAVVLKLKGKTMEVESTNMTFNYTDNAVNLKTDPNFFKLNF